MIEGSPRAGLRLFTWGGTRVEVHPSFIALLLLLSWALATSILPAQELRAGQPELSATAAWALGVGGALLLLLSVLVHEAAHAIVARWRGLDVPRITLFVHAGLSPDAAPARSSGEELAVAAAGPVATWILAAAAAASAAAWHDVAHLSPLLRFLTVTNVLLGIAHVVPGLPLDGGRIVGALAWGLTGSRHAGARWSARLGQVLSLALGLGCALQVGRLGWRTGWTWGVLFALLLWMQSTIAVRLALERERMWGLLVRDVMQPAPSPVSRVMSVGDLLVERVASSPRPDAWLVEFGGRLGGFVGVRDLHAVPPAERMQVPVGQVMRRLEHEHVLTPGTRLEVALQRMTRDRIPLLPVVHDGTVVGVLTRDVLREVLSGSIGRS